MLIQFSLNYKEGCIKFIMHNTHNIHLLVGKRIYEGKIIASIIYGELFEYLMEVMIENWLNFDCKLIFYRKIKIIVFTRGVFYIRRFLFVIMFLFFNAMK